VLPENIHKGRKQRHKNWLKRLLCLCRACRAGHHKASGLQAGMHDAQRQLRLGFAGLANALLLGLKHGLAGDAGVHANLVKDVLG
jgi:hypothetical protein